MYFYIFQLKKRNAFSNPTAEMAKLFGIPMSNLPGILVFTGAESIKRSNGIFFPIHVELFRDRVRAESRLTELFDTIGRLRTTNSDRDDLILALGSALRRWRANDRWRPVWDYAARQSGRLVNLPSDLAKKLAEGFAKGLFRDL
jgi:hypothetical protein